MAFSGVSRDVVLCREMCRILCFCRISVAFSVAFLSRPCRRSIPFYRPIYPTTMYAESHQILLTYIRAIRDVSRTRLLGKFALIADEFALVTPEDSVASLLDDHILAINARLEPLGMKIDELRHQVSAVPYYVFVNTKLDDTIKGATGYSAPELDAFKQIIDDVVDAGNAFSVGLVNAHQKVAACTSRPQKEAAFFVDRLVDDGWLELSTMDKLVLSIRALSELETYLMERFGARADYNDDCKLYVCGQCREIVTLGFTCGDLKCPIGFHQKCLDIYRRNDGSGELKCPQFGSCGGKLAQEDVERVGVDVTTLVAE